MRVAYINILRLKAIWIVHIVVFLVSIFFCYVLQFIVKDSVEERMVSIQRKKQDLLEKAFGSTNSDRKTSRIDDIKALMEL